MKVNPKKNQNLNGEIAVYTAFEVLDGEQFSEKPESIVEGLFHKNEFVLLSATAKSGKTLLATNLAIAIATGTPFLGKYPTRKARVLFIQSEVGMVFFRERLIHMIEGAKNV